MLVSACTGDQSAAVPAPAAEVTSEPAATATAPAAATVPASPEPVPGLQLLAHRGVHQTFNLEGIDDQTCTATRIYPPTHGFIENTIPSIEAAFEAGAAVVEIDIAPTTDGVLAVFHDWDVGCRTNGAGPIRSMTWEELSMLDIGYGYTADGETYPLRGQGEGLMPRLEEVFTAFPDGAFLINFKSDDEAEATLLREVVQSADAAEQVWAVYGGAGAVDAYLSLTDARGFTEASVRACVADYLTATADLFPPSCEDTVIAVPLDIAPVLSDWPHQFVDRMANNGTDVIVSGPGNTGIDTLVELDDLPADVGLYVWTNKIEELTG